MSHQFTISDTAGETIIAAMRRHLPGELSWAAVRKILQGNRVTIGGVVCVDEARRLAEGEVVTVNERPVPPPPTDKDVAIRHVDKDIIVVEKPSGMITLRRASEKGWSWTRRNQQPTLDECVPRLIGEHAAKRRNSERVAQKMPKLYSVHRIDRDSSGLLIFTRNEEAQKNIIAQFAAHDAVRKYFALVPGRVADQTVSTQFIRDRGDGLRGSTTDTSIGQNAVTNFTTLRTIGKYSELECRLETGRTNQIRIHLAELGNPICGDIKYRGAFGREPIVDDSRVHRMCLHAAMLRFKHPTTHEMMLFETPWPVDMQRYLNRLTAAAGKR